MPVAEGNPESTNVIRYAVMLVVVFRVALQPVERVT
jgi:hypothetical protein